MEIKKFKGVDYESIRAQKIYFEGREQTFPVFRIPLDKLQYNIQNARIGIAINDYNKDNPTRRLEIILKEDVEEFNNIISKFIIKSDKGNRFYETKKNIKERSQQVAGVILDDGTIIDGNRRFTSLRELKKESLEGEFAYFETIIIDSNGDDEARKKNIKILEIHLQHGQDEKVGYSPISKLEDIYTSVRNEFNNNNALLTDEEYWHAANMKKSEYDKLKARMEIMVDFCQYIGMHEKFSVVEELKLDGPINEVLTFKNKLKKLGLEDNYETIYRPLIFTILVTNKDGDVSRDLRELLRNPDNGHLERIKDQQNDNLRVIHENLQNATSGHEIEAIREVMNMTEAKSLIKTFEDEVIIEKRKKKQEKSFTYVETAISNLSSVDSDNFPFMPQDEISKIREGLTNLRNKVMDLQEKLPK